MITTDRSDAREADIEVVTDDRTGEDTGDHGDTPAPSVLRSSAVTAERERVRLEQNAGKSPTGRMLAGAVLAVRRLGTPEAATDGLRYRPVAWTVIALLAVAWYLPGRVDRAAVPEIAAAPSPVTTAVPSADPPAAEEPPEPDLQPGMSPPSFDPAPAPSPSFSPPSDAPSSGAPTPSTVPTTGASPPETSLTVRASGWASRIPPSPLPVGEPREDSLPVANRLGSVDRVSFIRLDGDGTTLELTEDSDAAREALGPGAVAACLIVDGTWSEGPGQSFDDAPEWDDESCVGGVENDDRWTFDLASFDDPSGDAGFALVPTTDAPPDFQIAFMAG